MALTKVSNNMLVQPVNHNILINPSFTVKQRGDVIEHEDSNSAFGPDRWRVRPKDLVGGTKVESSTEIDAATGINKLVVKHPRDATDPIKSYAYINQYIEAVNIQGFYGKEMTLSFSYSDTGGSGVPKVKIEAWGSSTALKNLYEAVPTSLGNNRWTCTFTLSTPDGTIPDPNEIGIQVLIWPNEGNNAPNEWSVWETKLEVGSVATPFIARPYGEELALCQRYYFEWNTNESNIKRIAVGQYTSSTAFQGSLSLPVSMRAAPDVDFNCDVWGGGTYAISALVVSDSIGTFSATTETATSNNLGAFRFNTAGEYLKLDAEL